MQPMHRLEIRRQLAHLLYGPLLITLFHYGWINLSVLFGLIVGGSLMSYFIKKERMHGMRRLLGFFERDHHMKHFPGRGILFFTIGAYLNLIIFPTHFAYAGILILSVGDAISNVVGRHFGRIKTRLNPDKFVEGSLVGILASAPIAYYFLPNWWAALATATIAMVFEMPHLRIGRFEIDDNLLIPLSASFSLTLFDKWM
ncbi:hypothetical protein IPJ72_06180 [Candidatus Peregrinibacteria bacterium]|nr:MAG: hypothetical protein IPJ72_06180 [Candidatus Peregrinibacteria bacterium]